MFLSFHSFKKTCLTQQGFSLYNSILKRCVDISTAGIVNHLGIISQPHCAIGWDSKGGGDLAPRESRAGKWLLAELLQFGTSRSGLKSHEVAGTGSVSHQQSCWRPECFTPGRNCCHSMTSTGAKGGSISWCVAGV